MRVCGNYMVFFCKLIYTITERINKCHLLKGDGFINMSTRGVQYVVPLTFLGQFHKFKALSKLPLHLNLLC